jgi:hypothetical protein
VTILSIITPSLSMLLYAKSLLWASDQGWDENMISIIYFLHTLSFGVGSVAWVLLMHRLAVGKCLFGAGILYLTNAFYFAPINTFGMALLLSAVTGLASSSSGTLYMGCQFFDEWEGSLSSKIRKYGWLECWRTIASGLIQGALIKVCLSPDVDGSLNPTAAVAIYTPILLVTLGIALVLLLASRSKMSTTTMPRIKVSPLLQLKSYQFLAGSQFVESFISYQTVFVLSWLLLDGFSASQTGLWLQLSAVATGILIFAFSRIVAPWSGTPKCFGIVTTSFVNPTLLMGLLMMAAPGMTSNSLLFFMAMTFFLQRLKEGLIGIWRIQVISSRWRVVTYYGYELFFTSVISSTSPFIMRSMAKAMSLSLDSTGPAASSEAAAKAIFWTSLPFVAVSLLLQIVANRYFYTDSCDVYTKSQSIRLKSTPKRTSSEMVVGSSSIKKDLEIAEIVEEKEVDGKPVAQDSFLPGDKPVTIEDIKVETATPSPISIIEDENDPDKPVTIEDIKVETAIPSPISITEDENDP